MAADARRVVRALPGVRAVTVVLEDHYTGDEINRAMARGDGFMGAFPGETADDDLEALRELFVRKALVARQGRIVEALLAEGCRWSGSWPMRVADLPDGVEARRCVEFRAQLGLAAGPDAPALVSGDGRAVAPRGWSGGGGWRVWSGPAWRRTGGSAGRCWVPAWIVDEQEIW